MDGSWLSSPTTIAMLQFTQQAALAISPLIGFIPQLYTKQVKFSPLLSLILITSSLLKFVSYIKITFARVILLQALTTIITQMVVIHLYNHSLGHLEAKVFDRNKQIREIKKKYGLLTASMVLSSSFILGYFLLSKMLLSDIHIYEFAGYSSVFLEVLVGFMQIWIKRVDDGLGNQKAAQKSSNPNNTKYIGHNAGSNHSLLNKNHCSNHSLLSNKSDSHCNEHFYGEYNKDWKQTEKGWDVERMGDIEQEYIALKDDLNKKLPKELFFCWIVGDIWKLAILYNIKAEYIFKVPIYFQITTDLYLLFQ